MTTIFFSPLSFVAVFGRDPRSGIPDPGWVKKRIRDKHPGSATLVLGLPDPDPLVRSTYPDPSLSHKGVVRTEIMPAGKL
jgi:hypothetical protein